MVTIILASHKNLAKGMKSTVEYILGSVSFIKDMNAYTTDDYDIYKDTEQLLENTDQVIVITDIIGGSVNNHWMNYVYDKKLTQKITILSGMTLSLIMELCTNIENPDLFKILPQIIQSAQSSIVNCTKLLEEEEIK